MEYKNFCENVMEQIKGYLPTKYNVTNISVYEALKSNGVRKIGLVFENQMGEPQPAIYLEEFFREFKNGSTIEEICKWIIEVYEEAMEARSEEYLCDLTSYENVCDKIVMRLINYDLNEEFLSNGVPHMRIADLAVCYYIHLHTGKTGMASVVVRDEMLNKWGISVEELEMKAKENTLSILKPGLYSVNNLLVQNKIDLLETGDKLEDGVLYTLVAETGSYGAVLILFPEIMSKVKEMLGDCYIIPSSVHETLLLSKKSANPVELGRMVREVNAMCVEKEEWLSQHVYEVADDSDEMRLEIVEESRADWYEEQ